MNSRENIIEGFRYALANSCPSDIYSPLYEVASMLLGRSVKLLSSSGKRVGTFIAEMESFSNGSFVPIVEFPVGLDKVDITSSIITAVEEAIIRQGNISSNVATGIKYMIEECVNNILEHSRSDYGYITSSFDNVDGTLDICIADKGITRPTVTTT